MTKYEFGTYDETPEGKVFRVIATAKCDSDAQAELTARQIGDRPEEYDITDMDGDELASLFVRRGDASWSVSI